MKFSPINSTEIIIKGAQIALKKLNKVTVIGRGGFGKVSIILPVGMEGGSSKIEKAVCDEVNV